MASSSSSIESRVPVGDLEFDVDIGGPSDGVPVVLLHGFPETKAAWRPLTTNLTGAGLRVIAPNQRGYSPGARPSSADDYDIEHLVSDVVGLLDALDVSDVHLVGHDWGAVVAWFVAVEHPDRVRTLTAASIPHPGAFNWALRHDEDQQRRSAYFRLFRKEGAAERVLLAGNSRRLRAMFGDGIDSALVDEHVRLLSEPGALTAALSWYRTMSAEFASLAPVGVPTTYVWGSDDMAVGRAAAERCGQYVSGPYRFIELAGANHWIPEEATIELADAILDRVNSE